MAAIALLGFGELGGELGRALSAAGVGEVRVYVRPRADPGIGSARAERIEAAGARPCESLEEAVAGAFAVLSAVPAGGAREAAERALPGMEPGTVFADLTSSAPANKEAVARRAQVAGVLYADAAVLGTVAVSGAAVPILACGSGARALADLGERAGLNVSILDAPAGHATRVKLLRSVYMKGRDALVTEMMVAARRLGLDAEVVQSIGGPGEQVPFDALVDRLLAGVAVHAGRRADELDAAADLLREAGVEPLVAAAGTERLRRFAELGLRERFGAQRPDGAGPVLDALERLAADDS